MKPVKRSNRMKPVGRSNSKVRVVLSHGVVNPQPINMIGPKDAVLDCKTGNIKFFDCPNVEAFYLAFKGQTVTLTDAANSRYQWVGVVALHEKSGEYYIAGLTKR